MTTSPTPVAGLTTRPATGTNWQALGLCRQTDPEVFFPEKGGSSRDAKQVCLACDVLQECRDYALKNDERFGVWGGLSEYERRKIRWRRKAATPPPVPVLVPAPEPMQPGAGRPPQGGGTPPAPCGTETAHRRHVRNNEPIDEACAAAHLIYLDETSEARRVRRQRSKERARARAQQAAA